MIVDFCFVFLHINVMFCSDTPPLPPAFSTGCRDRQTIAIPSRRILIFVASRKTYAPVKGLILQATAAASQLVAKNTPLYPGLFQCFLVSRTVDAVCVSDTRLPRHDLREEAIISTERTCIRRLAGSVSEAT